MRQSKNGAQARRLVLGAALFSAAMSVLPISSASAQEMLIDCPGGFEIHCTYTRDANGNVVIDRCTAVCL